MPEEMLIDNEAAKVGREREAKTFTPEDMLNDNEATKAGREREADLAEEVRERSKKCRRRLIIIVSNKHGVGVLPMPLRDPPALPPMPLRDPPALDKTD